MTRAILWDLDGTLVDSEPVHELAFDAASKELGLTLPSGFHDELLGSSGQDVHAKLAAVAGLRLGFEEWRVLKMRHFAAFQDRITLLDGIPQLLRDLVVRAVPMAVVSNSTRAEVDLSLNATGIRDNFGVTLSRSDVSDGKPAPDGYLLAASRLNQRPQSCLVIEDSPTGAAAGLAAGMHVVFHPQSPCLHPPEGAYYLPPSANLRLLIETFLFSGELL